MRLIHKYLPEMVYGSIDGTVTTFAIISGVAGAGLSPAIVIILGVSNVLADGFSMASSNYLSVQSERQRDGDDHSATQALKAAIATFGSFVTVGTVPISAYIISHVTGLFAGQEYIVSIVFTGMAFVFIGALRGYITRTSVWRAIIETLAIGAIAALVAYSVGSWLSTLTS